jgi:RimJ/RimL family protein N-acetyltransferase
MHVETARLVIRTFEERDAEPWLAMVNDPNVTRFLPPGPHRTLETFQDALQKRHALEREHGYAMWAIDLKNTGAFIGQCGFHPAKPEGPEIELAYHLATASWGHGYATEAAIAVLTEALRLAGVNRVFAVVSPKNVGSLGVVEKAGMRFDGRATYYDIPNWRKYIAEPERWRPPAT